MHCFIVRPEQHRTASNGPVRFLAPLSRVTVRTVAVLGCGVILVSSFFVLRAEKDENDLLW
jgi:hypothetical protein